MKALNIFVFLTCLCANISSLSAEEAFLEDFVDLKEWEPYYFNDYLPHASYTLVELGTTTALEAESKSAASALITKRTFSSKEFSKLTFRWRAENTIPNADGHSKETDDYPLRIYLIFDYPNTSTFQSLVSLFSGEKLPHSSVNYVWSSTPQERTLYASPYTSRVRIYPVEKGEEHVGIWRTYTRSVRNDYQRAFGDTPPPLFRIAIMSDTDNTGTWAKGWVDFVKLERG